MKKVFALNVIYVLKNTANNKVYVGQTWLSLKDRWNNSHGYSSSLKINNAIKKYGKNSFYYEVLTVCGTQETADYWETFFIQKHDSINKGYNIAIGGSSVMRGRKHSKESIDRMSESHKGNTAHLGKLHSKESRKKISEATIKQIKENGHPSFGRKHSEESIQKMSKNRSGVRSSIKTEFKPKITYDVAEQIRRDNKIGFSNKEIAVIYNISLSLVSMILTNKRWIKNE
jgi:group I intron endonuclease